MNAPLAMANAVRCVDLADDATARRIDGFVAEQRASLFHRPAWLRAIEAGTGQASLGFVSERLGALTRGGGHRQNREKRQHAIPCTNRRYHWGRRAALTNRA